MKLRQRALRLRIGQDIDIRIVKGSGVGSSWAGNGGGVRAELQLARQDLVRSALSDDQQNIVGGSGAQLRTQAAGVKGVHDGRSPWASHLRAGAADQDATAIVTPIANPTFLTLG